MRPSALLFTGLMGMAALASITTAGQSAVSTTPTAGSMPEQSLGTAAKAGVEVTVPPLLSALELCRSGKFADAEAVYNAVLKTDPKSTSALVGLMRTQLKEKRLAEADVSLAQAMAVNPNSEEVQTAQGELYFRQARLPEAEQIFTSLVRKGTTQARAYLGLGMIYWATSTYQHAKLMLDKAYESDPNDPDIRRRWLTTLTRKERIKALKGYLEGETDDDAHQREHLETSLLMIEEAEESARQGCRLTSKTTELHVKMEPLMYNAKMIRGYGLKAELNGTKGTFLIDTGSSGLLINRKIAEKAGIKPIVHTDVHGIGDKGSVTSFIGVADSIRIGDLELQGCHVEVLDRNSVSDEDGLIGGDLFSHFLVSINFPDRKFDLTPLPAMPAPSDAETALRKKYPDTERFHDRYIAPEMKNYSSVYRFGHMLLIPTRINDSRAKLFLIDTGAFTDTISPAAAKEFTKVRGEDQLNLTGLNGAVNKVFTADDIKLTFSHFRQPARDMVAFDTSKISNDAGAEVSGMLGFAMLFQMSLKIDYRDGLVDFEYDPKRFH
jgi:tetratricopeptide (TPR) repeat protein